MADYFVIDGRDGDVTIERFTKRELMRGLNEGDFGDMDELIFTQSDNVNAEVAISAFGNDGLTIIRGEIVEPQAKAQVTMWEV